MSGTESEYSIKEQIRRLIPISVPPEQKSAVARICQILDHAARDHSPRVAKCKFIGPDGRQTDIPETLQYALERVAELLAQGGYVTIVPFREELTTRQAAGILNVPHEYLIHILNEGIIPFDISNGNRRLKTEDVIVYRKKRDREREDGLEKLVRMTEEFGGYTEEFGDNIDLGQP